MIVSLNKEHLLLKFLIEFKTQNEKTILDFEPKNKNYLQNC